MRTPLRWGFILIVSLTELDRNARAVLFGVFVASVCCVQGIIFQTFFSWLVFVWTAWNRNKIDFVTQPCEILAFQPAVGEGKIKTVLFY